MKKIYRYSTIALCAFFVLFHIYTALFGVIGNNGQKCIHLSVIFGILFIGLMEKDEKNIILVILDTIFLIAGVASMLYIWYVSPTYDNRGGITTNADILFGALLIVTLIYATWRKIGPVLAIVATVFIVYAFGGMYAPSLLQHGGFKVGRYIHLIVFTSDGILGSPLNASANYIVIFIILGAVFSASGVGDYFTSLATAAFGRFRGGPAKVAVIASAFFGSISGSSIANVIGTGTFTIPMMKKMKFEPEFAGAVEATASTGGQIMPPIMGAAAFLVAEILQVSYWDVVKAAVIPAFLYFAAILMTVDLYARRKGIEGLDKSELPTISKLIKKGYLFSPLVLLMILIGPLAFSITKAGIYVLLFTLIVVSFNKESRFNKKKLIDTFISAGKGCISVAIACALVGIIIGTVVGSGLGYRLSNVLVTAAGGRLNILLIMTMFVSLILGMGLPTSAAYLVLATMVAPAMIKMGVLPMAAHLFLFYFGIISNVTPPVAMASYAAAGIAQCNPSKCGFAAFKLAISGFILPFMFVYNPVLLNQGIWYEVLYSVFTALAGVYCLSCVTENFFMKWNINVVQRIMLGVAALLLIQPGIVTDIIGAVLVIGVLAGCQFRNFSKSGVKAPK